MPESPENKNGVAQRAETDAHLRRIWDISYGRLVSAVAALSLASSLTGDVNRLSLSPQNTTDDSNMAQAHVSPTQPTAKSENASESKKYKNDCTSIRTRPNYIYMGKACLSRGDTFTRIGKGKADKGWVYGGVKLAVKGPDIYKCGFVGEGILPQREPRSRSITHCKNYYQRLVKEGDVFFDDYNCSPIKNGYDPCVDGTYFSPIQPGSPNKKTYENFESDEPSPLNVYGTGQGGFRGVIKKNKRTSVHYRTEYQIPTSKGTIGIVVRAPKWGWADTRTVSEAHRSGGPLKVK